MDVREAAALRDGPLDASNLGGFGNTRCVDVEVAHRHVEVLGRAIFPLEGVETVDDWFGVESRVGD